MREAFRFPQLPHEVHAHYARTRLHRNANLQPGVSRKLHVGFPLGIRNDVAIERRGRGLSPGFTTHLQQSDALAIEAHFQLMREPHADEIFVKLPLQLDPDDVLAVQREMVAHREAAARAERQIVAHAVVLVPRAKDLVGVEHRNDCGIAYRQTADGARRRHVSLHVNGRDRQHAGDVVETLVHIVRSEKRLAVDIHREQIANRIGVFRPIQAMHRHAPGIGLRIGRGIDGGLQP